MHMTASFHGRGWWPALKHAANRFISHSGCADQAHLRMVQVWPDMPGADLLAAFCSRLPTSSLLNGGSVHVGCGGGSSLNISSTSGGVWGKKRCDRMSVISLCECTNPSVPFSDGTLDSLHPCLHAATSQ